MSHNPFLSGQVPGADRFDALDTQSTYTPALTASGTNPNVGSDGFINGVWHRNGHMINVWVEVEFGGTGINFGGSSWRVTLPFLADLSLHTAGSLAAGGSHLGDFKVRATVVAFFPVGTVLLHEENGGANIGKAVIFYTESDSGSLGGVNFGAADNAQLLFNVSYIADPSAL